MAVSNTKGFRTRNLRYKRSALASMGYGEIERELSEIIEACDDIRWFQDDEETLLNALDGDEEAAYEFQMMFSDLRAKAEQLYDALLRCDAEEEYDICTVALIGNRYQCVGFDMIEEDYYSLTFYERELACTEAGKRLTRHTKAEMISIIGQCVGVLVAFLNLRQSYDYLKATFDILRDENTSLLQMVRQIDELYERAAEVEFRSRCLLTWKISATPAGRSLFRLRALVPRIGATDAPLSHPEPLLWKTPIASDAANRTFYRNSRGEPNLSGMVKLWPTPKASDSKGSGAAGSRSAEHDLKHGNLKGAVMYATPQARDYRTGQGARWENPDRSRNLNDQIAFLFPTPTTGAGLCGGTGNYQQLKALENAGKITPEERRNMAAGNGAQLNPDWVEWLMGFPVGWTEV